MRNISKISLLCIFTVILMQVSAIAFAADISYNNDQNNTTQEQIENIQSTDNIDTENELQPMMANNCDPLNYYFGNGYSVTSSSGPWIYITGVSGITGAYNTSTGAGYVNVGGEQSWFNT